MKWIRLLYIQDTQKRIIEIALKSDKNLRIYIKYSYLSQKWRGLNCKQLKRKVFRKTFAQLLLEWFLVQTIIITILPSRKLKNYVNIFLKISIFLEWLNTGRKSYDTNIYKRKVLEIKFFKITFLIYILQSFLLVLET